MYKNYSSQESNIYTIKINTNFPGDNYWIRIRRNNQYIPHNVYSQRKESIGDDKEIDWNILNRKKEDVEEPNWKSAKNKNETKSEWITVNRKKKNDESSGEDPQDKLIYYWVVDSHNLFDRRNKSYKLFFIEPDSTQIENMDQTDYMAMDESGQLRLLHSQLKHNGMKMNPTFYIARTIKQIKTALKYVKYCVVKIENNEQKLIENPKSLQTNLFLHHQRI